MSPKPFSFTQFAKNAPANPLESHTFKTKDLKCPVFTHLQKKVGGGVRVTLTRVEKCVPGRGSGLQIPGSRAGAEQNAGGHQFEPQTSDFHPPERPSIMRPGEFSRRRAMKKMLVLLGVLLAALTMIAPLRAQQAPPLDELKKTAIAEVDNLHTFTQQMVDQIYSYSELGFQEFQTSRYVSGILERNGFRVERGVVGIPTAWVATWGSGKPIIAFITDIDCIPCASQKPGVSS